MADGTRLNPGAGGDLAATDDITDGGVANLQKVQRVKAGFGADGAYEDVEVGVPLPVDPLALTSPQTKQSTSASVAAGGTTDLDSTQVTAAKTGKLIGLVIGASVALKGELKTVLNGVESAVKATWFSLPGVATPLLIPSREFYTQVHDAAAGFDGFRVTLINLDTTQASDVHATFLWDEV